MSAYDNDPRVMRHEDGSFTVSARPGAEAYVVFSKGRYLAYPPGQFVGGMYMDCNTADEAIRSLIGDPQ